MMIPIGGRGEWRRSRRKLINSVNNTKRIREFSRKCAARWKNINEDS
jgi:hypothetical protein